ncbi:hypothetical protein D9M73_51250 [compost metagenome]
MSEHTVKIVRGSRGNMSANSLGTDALAGVLSIPGVLSAEITAETDTEVSITYRWDGRADFQTTDEHLVKFHVQKVWKA